MTNKMRAFFSDGLVQSSGLLFVAFMITSITSYLFQVVMGRLLGPSQYGFFNALLSLMMMLSVPVATLLMVVSRKVAEYKAKQDYARIRGLFMQVTRNILAVGGVGFAIFAMGSGAISGYLHSSSILPVLLTGVAAFLALAAPINTAFLQGLQDYRWLGVSTGAAGPAKLFFCAVLVLMGFGVNGAVSGLVITGAFMWILSYLPLKKHLAMSDSPHGSGHLPFSQVIPVFLANLAFIVLTQADIVLVNRYFLSHQAGVYASAAILGRSVMYIPASIVLAMFPMVSEKRALNKSSGHLLVRSLIATTCLSGSGVVLFYFLPEWTINTFFGFGYLEAAPFLKYFGLAMLPMAFLMVLMNYLVAKEKTLFAYIMLSGAILEICAISLHHQDPIDIVKIMGVAGTLTLAVSVAAQWAPTVLSRSRRVAG